MIAVPTRPTRDGIVAVTTGPAFGAIEKLSTNGLLAPTRLLAVRVVVKLPLAVGMPVMAPVVVFKVSPGGRLLGDTIAKLVRGAWLARIW